MKLEEGTQKEPAHKKKKRTRGNSLESWVGAKHKTSRKDRGTKIGLIAGGGERAPAKPDLKEKNSLLVVAAETCAFLKGDGKDKTPATLDEKKKRPKTKMPLQKFPQSQAPVGRTPVKHPAPEKWVGPTTPPIT